MDETQNIQSEINAYKQLLTQTDYQAIKHSEGEMSDEEYQQIKDQRAEWRAKVNELEAELESLAQDGLED